jgi:hypothetical protein
VDSDYWSSLPAVRQDTALRDKTAVTIQRSKGLADQLRAVTPQAYFAAEIWSKQNSSLKALEIRALQNAAFAAAGDKSLSRRDAERADETLRRLVDAGFAHEDLGPYRRT